MDKTALYRLWAPRDETWSPWVKPVPFAHFTDDIRVEAPRGRECVSWTWLPEASSRTALILDLPGGESIPLGVSLLEKGYRPIPIFSSCSPNPDAPRELIVRSAVQTNEIVAALADNGPRLAALGGLNDLVPVFLLDAKRQAQGLIIDGDIFDNRSALFESDFPSARTLRDHDVTKCLVVRDPVFPLSDDLRYALLPWAKAGISIDLSDLQGDRTPFPVPPTGYLGVMIHRVSLFFALRRGQSGGFGRFVPESAGG